MTIVPAAAIAHIADWARAAGAEKDPDVAAFIALGADMGQNARMDSAIADWLYDADGRAHGYSLNRALRPNREDCELCSVVGAAIAAETTRTTRGLAWGTLRASSRP